MLTEGDDDTTTTHSKKLGSRKPNQFDKMMMQGAFRKKQGVVKNDVQMKFYYDEGQAKDGLPRDLIDFYLEERFNIVLGKDNSNLASANLAHL